MRSLLSRSDAYTILVFRCGQLILKKRPSFGLSHTSTVFPIGSGWTITGLSQKINIVAPNLVVGWFGSYPAAKYVLKELKKQNENKLFNRTDVNSFFQEIGEDIEGQEVGFLVYIQESETIYSNPK